MAASGSGHGSVGGGQQRSDEWQQELRVKNTFLEFPSPWIDDDLRNIREESESGRPSSDPTSNSSRSSSLSGWSSEEDALATSGKQRLRAEAHDFEQRLKVFEEAAGRIGEVDAAASSSSPVPMWTPGAEGHEERKCNPCMYYWKLSGCRDGGNCKNCHWAHEPKKKRHMPSHKRTTARLRPHASVRKKADVAAAQASADGAAAKSTSEAAKTDRITSRLDVLLLRAEAEGDAFDFDAADYIPNSMKKTAIIRERFLETLAERRGLAAPSDGLGPNVAAGRVADCESSHASSDEVFSL